MPLAAPHPYTLQLPAFEGPLDLLLRLIEKQELEITAISLALVADQYLAHVRAMRDPDPLAVAEFLALAAQLLLIKSRALLPRPEAGPAAGGDEISGEELARRLREYQRFKQAAERLRAWEAAGLRMWERTAAAPLPAA
ncbi:MAG TPA: ScpA family protein, partial [Herpetosiphonaceae bacterium]